MKKIIMIMIVVCLVCSVCACGVNSSNISNKSVQEDSINKDNHKESETEIENKINSINNNSTSEQKKSSIEYKTVNFAEPIILDFVEMTIDGADYGDEVKPDNPERVYRYHSDKEGEKFIYIYGTIKNTSGNKFEFGQNMYAAMTFDNKYNYNASISADENGSFSYLYAYLDPLKSEKFYICASVPDELIEEYSQMVVNFGFKTNFEHKYGIQEKDCDYLYSITISK